MKVDGDGPHLLASGNQLMCLKKHNATKEDGSLIQPNGTYVPEADFSDLTQRGLTVRGAVFLAN